MNLHYSTCIAGGLVVAGGIKMCIAGFSEQGLALRKDQRISGRRAKVIGVVALFLSLGAAALLIITLSWELPKLPSAPPPPPPIFGQ